MSLAQHMVLKSAPCPCLFTLHQKRVPLF